MRKELTEIQLIEKYVLGKLTIEEKIAFETRLAVEDTLRVEVEKQKLVMETTKRMGLKSSAKKGFKKYKAMKNLKYIVATIAVLGTAALLYYAVNNKEVVVQQSPEDLLPEQSFVINNAKDTVIETDNGMVLVIPANAFIDEKGNKVANVNFEVKEAFETVDILKAGLTTLSNGELLETGGMFFLNAYSNGKKLELAKDKKILAEIPNLNPREDMMLFDGEKQADGSINWVNPIPFEKDLITYDITTLDFYPEGYLEELKTKKSKVLIEATGDIPERPISIEEAKKLGLKNPKKIMTEEEAIELGLIIRKYKDVITPSSINTNDKQFTDSLYYSFARLFDNNLELY